MDSRASFAVGLIIGISANCLPDIFRAKQAINDSSERVTLIMAYAVFAVAAYIAYNHVGRGK